MGVRVPPGTPIKKNTMIYLFENDIDIKLINELLHCAKNANSTHATVGHIIDSKVIRKINKNQCTASFIDYSNFADKIIELSLICKKIVENKFSVNCIDKEINFLRYNDGARYWPHVDGQYLDKNVAKRAGVSRDITCVTYLNDDYIGGDINFKFLKQSFSPKKGNLLIYPGNWNYMHEVMPVTGIRYAIVIWFHTNPHMYDDEIISDPTVLHLLKIYNKS